MYLRIHAGVPIIGGGPCRGTCAHVLRSSDVERRPATRKQNMPRALPLEVPARQEMPLRHLQIAGLSLSVYLPHVLDRGSLLPEPPVLLAS